MTDARLAQAVLDASDSALVALCGTFLGASTAPGLTTADDCALAGVKAVRDLAQRVVVGASRESVAERAEPSCPECQAPLKRVTYPGGYLNEDQWSSVSVGDWYCDAPSTHQRERNRGNVYFWNSEVRGRAADAPPAGPWGLAGNGDSWFYVKHATDGTVVSGITHGPFSEAEALAVRDALNRVSGVRDVRAEGGSEEPR